MRSTISLFALSALLLRSTCALPQTPDELLARYGDQWKDQPGVMLKMNTIIRIENTSHGIIAVRSVERERIFLKPASGENEGEEVGYSTLIPLSDLNAWTMVPKDRSYKKTTVTAFTHRDEREGSVFHDDSRNVQFNYPGLTTGAITHLDYVITYPDVRMCAGHFFAAGLPVEESTVTIIADKDIAVEGKLFHVPSDQMRYEHSTEHGRDVQRWTMEHVAPLAFEQDAPDLRYYAPHLQFIVRQPGEKGTDVDRMYAWNYSHLREAIADNDTSLQRIAQQVTAGLSGDRAKAAALYHWVQDHVKYVAVEDGLNGMVPAQPVEVCDTRYGDCKGMANLLRSLMTNAGLKAHVAWIGSRGLPYSYDELPNSATDDHMITAWEDGTDILLMDPTSNSTPFGMPSAFIQGKQAMIALDADHFRLMNVPVMPSAMNDAVDSVVARLEGTTLIGSGTTTFTGYQRAQMSDALQRVERKKWGEMLRTSFVKGNNRYQVDSVTADGIADRDHPLRVHYTFSVPGFATLAGTEAIMPRVLFDPLASRYYGKERKVPVEEDFLWTTHEVVRIDLPAGAKPVFLPEATAKDGAAFGYAFRAEMGASEPGHQQSLMLHNDFHFDTLMLDTDALGPWRTFYDGLTQDEHRTIVIDHPTE